MDVELYVYDLSQGMARMYSLALTGTHMDAIYHTSLVFNNIEYYFGQGIQTARPGSTHHGQPMEKISMGKSELPSEVVEEYLQSLSEIYTPESYDLFLHNCNNFTQDLAMFLVGKSIPDHIRNLPETFLRTPLGQMLKPQIESALRGVVQAPGPGLDARPAPAPAQNGAQHTTAQKTQPVEGKVRTVTNLAELDRQLSAASSSCAVIFFTSATCPPCKMMYPVYDELAEEAGPRATLIKVDTSIAPDVGMRYAVHATPTFMTFLHGQKLDQWAGADPGKLRGNVRLLIEMAYPAHPHSKLHLPSLQRRIDNYVLYKKVPPLEKLVVKLKPHDQDPAMLSIIDFIKHRTESSTADTALPSDLPSFGPYLTQTFSSLPLDTRFALVDLVRLLFLDPRVASYFAEDTTHSLLLTLFTEAENEQAPYNMRIVSLQLACNIFTSSLYANHLAGESVLRQSLLALVTSALLDEHTNLRVVAASLAFNLSALNHNARFSSTDQSGNEEPLTEEDQVSLVASISEALSQESSSAEAIHGLLFAVGLLVYEAPGDGAVVDLCRALDLKGVVKDKEGVEGIKGDVLVREVGTELLGKGL